MSAGGFVDGLYLTGGGNLTTIRVQPETLDLDNGTVTNEIGSGNANPDFPSATVGGSRRTRGKIFARMVSLRLVNQSDPPAGGYVGAGILRVPIVQQTLWASLTKASVVTYLGKPYRVVGKTPEKVT